MPYNRSTFGGRQKYNRYQKLYMRRIRAQSYLSEHKPKKEWSAFALRLWPYLANVDPSEEYKWSIRKKNGRPRIVDLERDKRIASGRGLNGSCLSSDPIPIWRRPHGARRATVCTRTGDRIGDNRADRIKSDDIVEKALGLTQAGVKLNRRSGNVSVSH
jgi:hypothetical protein